MKYFITKRNTVLRVKLLRRPKVETLQKLVKLVSGSMTNYSPYSCKQLRKTYQQLPVVPAGTWW